MRDIKDYDQSLDFKCIQNSMEQSSASDSDVIHDCNFGNSGAMEFLLALLKAENSSDLKSFDDRILEDSMSLLTQEVRLLQQIALKIEDNTILSSGRNLQEAMRIRRLKGKRRIL